MSICTETLFALPDMLYTYVIDDPDFKVSSLPEDNIEAFSV